MKSLKNNENATSRSNFLSRTSSYLKIALYLFDQKQKFSLIFKKFVCKQSKWKIKPNEVFMLIGNRFDSVCSSAQLISLHFWNSRSSLWCRLLLLCQNLQRHPLLFPLILLLFLFLLNVMLSPPTHSILIQGQPHSK